MTGRTSHEVRGLKYGRVYKKGRAKEVAPHTRCVDWNEKEIKEESLNEGRTSHEVRGLKYICFIRYFGPVRSHLTRGAWIEIYQKMNYKKIYSVAPHTRCVDWNSSFRRCIHVLFVAPHTRCVDWNSDNFHFLRNFLSRTSHEVRGLKWQSDRPGAFYDASHLTRGAWIEIIRSISGLRISFVAPHTRCVDWNMKYLLLIMTCSGRTSHEVRGLKCPSTGNHAETCTVAPHTRCVDWNGKIPLKGFPENPSHLTRGAWIEIFYFLHAMQ